MAWWINAYFNLPLSQRVDKKTTAVQRVAEWVDAQYRDGRTTSISDEEMATQVRAHLPQLMDQAV